ncbi:MAG: nucleotidyl transferase AbiEii/AbiGii toxin family protein [Nanoarchaeota archaeon]|nr:nucleotidyl transferase AbiEii/AbiGii toxin family protein [Nanoarchaeota archaeon]
MVEIKDITERELNLIAGENGFQRDLIVKDFYITVILYLLKDISGVFFKGGTALQKTFLDYARISEDIDFTLERELNSIKKEIISILNNSTIFGKISKDKDVTMFTRLIVPYKSRLGKDEIFIDLNERSKLLLKPERFKVNHFYSTIPNFSFLCLSKKEMIAEKIAAAISRNKPRDHYDIYKIIKHKLPIDMKLVAAKCKNSGNDPSIIKMFNKAKKLYNNWDEDMIPLIAEQISFQEVIKTLAEYFNLKKEKEQKR